MHAHFCHFNISAVGGVDHMLIFCSYRSKLCYQNGTMSSKVVKLKKGCSFNYEKIQKGFHFGANQRLKSLTRTQFTKRKDAQGSGLAFFWRFEPQ